MRTSSGCWTCRLRRKKCDEIRPVCNGCAALDITCHFDPTDKPEWMDGGAKQEEMAENLKLEIRERARYRRGHVTAVQRSSSNTTDFAQELSAPSRIMPTAPDTPMSDTTNTQSDETELSSEAGAHMPQSGSACTLINKDISKTIAIKQSDIILFAFYNENLLPFLFPFYRPSLCEGGRAWLFQLMLSSPVVRQATLCQSSYFFSIARGSIDHNAVWDQVLTQTTDALMVLRNALQVIERSSVSEHLDGAVRIMASIMQMQRFEIAVSRFHNCQNHLNAALALFEQLLHSAPVLGGPAACFNDVINRLGHTSSTSRAWSSQSRQLPIAEQAAFRFSSTLVIFDDVIASTALGEQPKLYEYHKSLLGCQQDTDDAPIDLETVVGPKNGILLCIGEIAALHAWKLRCKAIGNLDVVELVHRATAIKEPLIDQLVRLEKDSEPKPKRASSVFDVYIPVLSQSTSLSSIWAHAALVYLSTVVSGWQPANHDVRYHVSRVMELLKDQDSSVVLRAMSWPFCVAGCLAEPAQEAFFRGMVDGLQPASIFGTVHKALEVMENVWQTKGIDVPDRDFAMCFKLQGEVVLLV
jgi:hypothetical protein